MVRKGIISILLVLAVLSGIGGAFSFNNDRWASHRKQGAALGGWIALMPFCFGRNADIDICDNHGWAIGLGQSSATRLCFGGINGRLGICLMRPAVTTGQLPTSPKWKKQWTLFRVDRWQQGPDEFLNVCFPSWLAVILFSAYPLWALCRFVRCRRNRQGCCARCDYDLTGNVTGVCPECGMSVGSPNP